MDRLARGVAEAERLARPDRADLAALAAHAWPVLHRLGPTFLGAFRLRAVPAAAGTLRAVEALRKVYASSSRRWPGSLPTSFLRPAWRDAVNDAGSDTRRVWEAATLLALAADMPWPTLHDVPDPSRLRRFQPPSHGVAPSPASSPTSSPG